MSGIDTARMISRAQPPQTCSGDDQAATCWTGHAPSTGGRADLIKAPLESVRPDAVSRPNREQPESDRAADALGAGVRRAKRWFQTSVRVTKYAAVLHAGAGFLVLLLWWAYGNDPRATGLVWRLADALSPRVGMLESMRACRYPSSWSIALTTVVFATGHVLLLAWLIRGSLGTWWSYLQDRAKSPVFGLRTVDWLFWFPAAIALGCAAYWVTYIDIDTGAHIVCSPSPFNVWMYRMVSTSVTPFFVLLVTAPVDMIFISVHRLFTRRSTGS